MGWGVGVGGVYEHFLLITPLPFLSGLRWVG